MNLDKELTLDEIIALEMQLGTMKAGIAVKLRPADLIACKKMIDLHRFTIDELGVDFKKISSKKRGLYPVKYYDQKTGEYWTGIGSPKLAFMQAHREKRMDEYLISTERGQSVSKEIKKDVKVNSGEIIEYQSLCIVA